MMGKDFLTKLQELRERLGMFKTSPFYVANILEELLEAIAEEVQDDIREDTVVSEDA